MNGSQSEFLEMPENYTLYIWEYEINGTSLKQRSRGPDVIQVPMREIFLRRMHAVTDALNTKYPQGLVFDYNESQKRFTVTRPKHDCFRFAVIDKTMALTGVENAPQTKYLYTDSGFYKFLSLQGTQTCIVRPGAMVCRDLKEYNPSLYENLQIKYAPVGKDDDNQTYRDLWERLYSLRDLLVENQYFVERKQKRFIKAQTELPYDEQVFLFQVLNDLKETNRLIVQKKVAVIMADGEVTKEEAASLNNDSLDPKYCLDGDWVKGLWVDEPMVRIWETVRKALQTKDPIYTVAKDELVAEKGFFVGEDSGQVAFRAADANTTTADPTPSPAGPTTDPDPTTDPTKDPGGVTTDPTGGTTDPAGGTGTTTADSANPTKTDAGTAAVADTGATDVKPELEIYEFVELKRKLIEDRGRTKMSIYLVDQSYDSMYDPVLNHYSEFADFYFCKANKSPYAIPVVAIPPRSIDDGTGSTPTDDNTPTDSTGTTAFREGFYATKGDAPATGETTTSFASTTSFTTETKG